MEMSAPLGRAVECASAVMGIDNNLMRPPVFDANDIASCQATRSTEHLFNLNHWSKKTYLTCYNRPIIDSDYSL